MTENAFSFTKAEMNFLINIPVKTCNVFYANFPLFSTIDIEKFDSKLSCCFVFSWNVINFASVCDYLI